MLSILELYHGSLSNKLRAGPNRRERARLEQQKHGYERRILAYVKTVRDAAPGMSEVMIKLASERRRFLAGCPIDEAIRLVNSDFCFGAR